MILKRRGFTKFYGKINQIIDKLQDKTPLLIDYKTETQLKEMFRSILGPFYEVRPPTRKNFLSYSYVLHKLCRLLGRDDLVKQFPLLKSRQKLIIQDKIWKMMMEKLNWEFIPCV